MRYYEVIDHPADLKIKVFGEDLSDLFCNLVRAIASEQLGNSVSKWKPSFQVNRDWEEIIVESPDSFSLFVDFANEIIYRSDANNKIYADCEIEDVSENKIKAKISGVTADKKLDIKAATYHEGYVKQVDRGREAVILFDI
ncbi:MAG: archease [Patescibacteria group bacterium]|nr:archease [Patescibacteria group bacterium]